MSIAIFNKLYRSQKAKIFDREINRIGAHKRTPPISMGNRCAYFVFIDKTALVCITNDDGSFYFAVDAEKAEACLNETISRYKDIADETGWKFEDWRLASSWKFEDWRLTSAYIAAAEALKMKFIRLLNPSRRAIITFGTIANTKHRIKITHGRIATFEDKK